ncbi:hypothetical protein EDC94DRAFT_653863 [Helicostylum pulchrum]|nr:hypothetical protein EDC94DRAFT_653863 [Helicostylum pulchrum]
MFQRRIQLDVEDRSPWSIPCCSTFRSQRIQLSEDSDQEEEEQSITPFRIESTSFLQHPSNLSRNPFARVDQVSPKSITTTSPIEPQEERTEEPVNVSRNKYENEPDWTEIHEEEDNGIVKLPTLITEDTSEEDTSEEAVREEVAKEEVAKVEAARVDNASEVGIIFEVTAPEITKEEEEEVKEEDMPKKEEKIPQIEKEVLHLLPLPQLSNELPPTMIHKKPSFEKSMYGEAPLMTTSHSTTTNRISRFSMTEEDFLALKKKEEDFFVLKRQEEEFKKRLSAEEPLSIKQIKLLSMNDMIIPSKEITASPIEITPQTDPLSIPAQDHKQVTQRRSSMAQSILGDKLDDFTEKLAFIKKNIIMNTDSDEEDEEEADNAEETLKKIALLKQETTTSAPVETPRPLHRRTSSLMDVAPTLARFINQISAGHEPSSSQEEDQDEEELFDFTKVIEIGKNVRSFSEGFVGNGIRMLNDVATRIKTSSEEEDGEKQTEHENWINDSYI